jgi:DNA-binding transcriptional MerR regulator
MKISDAARELGVHPVTLKRLEKIGVIQPLRDRNGWRRLSQEDLQKARAYFYQLDGQENQLGK